MSPGIFETLRTWVRESFDAGVNLCLHLWYALRPFGEAYEWADSLEDGVLAWVRDHGIDQFLSMWSKIKDLESKELKWGDEIEFGIYTVDEVNGMVKCKLRGKEILDTLKEMEKEYASCKHDGQDQDACSWVPEYGAWMVEGTPEKAYTGFASAIQSVEKNMRKRRARLLSVLKAGEICPTVPCFPLMGVDTFTDPPLPPGGSICHSLFIPDGIINPHPRFAALTGNIRRRRGKPVDIRMPRFKDTKTPQAKIPAGGPQPTFVDDALSMDEVRLFSD